MGGKESALVPAVLGDSVDSVEALLKKHEDFQKSLDAQDEKTRALDAAAQTMAAGKHYDAAAVAARRDGVLARRAALEAASAARQAKLEAALRLQQFLRDAADAEGWMADKAQTASDPTYRDAANLRSKLQRHLAFQSELDANKVGMLMVLCLVWRGSLGLCSVANKSPGGRAIRRRASTLRWRLARRWWAKGTTRRRR